MKRGMVMERASGVLLPIFSLPSKYGIGCFSKEAYQFIDRLKAAGQSYWQILPLGPTGYGDSPYQSFSTFAGNPYFIDLETLTGEGLLTAQECEYGCEGIREDKIDYEKIYKTRFQILEKAFSRFGENDEYRAFVSENGIEIIGDIPIYVAFDSADTWSAPEMFRFNDALEPIDVAGCPPDGFSQTGQLWGNPLYDWEYHKKTGYDWWIRRIEHCFRLYDVVRIDHFRGFDEYYAVPYGEKTAVHGKWMPGPGIELFRTLEEKIGRKRIIAEDLGFLTPSVIQLLKESGFPGMKVLQFAFDSREDSNYLPHTYTRNCVVYTGTHDNDTTKGWYHTAAGSTRQFAKEYMYKPRLDEDTLAGDFIAMAMGSAADLCIVPMQDYLGLGSDARINTPSTLGGNREWRMKPGEPDEGTVREMERMTKIYGRLRFT